MFKIKIISHTVLLSSLFTIFSGCSGGGGENKKDSGEDNSTNPVIENPVIKNPVIENPVATPSTPDIECPAEYIRVPANSDVGVDNDFCVMKYEAKNGNNDPLNSPELNKAISQADKTPWVEINQNDSRTACKALNSESGNSNINDDTGDDGTYALISNPEWMALARNVESVPENWTSGTINTGCIKRGNVKDSRVSFPTVINLFDGHYLLDGHYT